MRRGFLNKKAPKTPSPRDAKVTCTAAKVRAPEKVDNGPVLIPRSPKPPLDIPFGIKLFPTGNFIFRMATLPVGDNHGPKVMCLLYPEAKEQILALPGFPADPEAATSVHDHRKLPYDILRIPGMGRGIFANVALDPGDLVMCERPLLLYPGAFPYVEGVTTHPDTFFTTMVENLTPTLRSNFYALHNCKGTNVSNIKGIVDTNGLHVGVLPGSYKGSYAAIGIQMSLFNHSCTPNAEHWWDLKSFTFCVRALRPIAKGEQIFISYLGDLLDTRAVRQLEMLNKYSFTCACAVCTLPKTDSIRSDIRRNSLSTARQWLENKSDFRDHESTLKKWAVDPALADDCVYKHSKLQLRLMEEEGTYIKHLWFSHCEIVSKALCALEDRAGVVELAKKAAVLSRVYTGNDGGWDRVAAAPEKTVWWGLRKKSTK